MPRPKAFDPAVKLDEAVSLFWREGFESTSIPALEKHLKINRFSIYDTYGDKRSLFLRVLDRYTELLVDELIRPLEDGVGGIADLGRFFATFKRKFAGPEVVHGCLMVNTATEIGGRDPDIAARVEAYFDSLERALLACLSRARELGEFEASNADLRSRARILRAGVEGILVELRLGRNSQEVGRTIRAMRASVPGLGARTRSAG